MGIAKNIILFILAVIVAHYAAVYFGFLYDAIFNSSSSLGAGWIGTEVSGAYFDGILSSYLFFVIVFLIGLGHGEKYKYILTIVFLLPALWFIVSVDLLRIWFYIFVAIIGWIIGFGLNRVFSKYFRLK